MNGGQTSDQDRLDDDFRKKAELENRLRQKGHEKDEATKHVKN